MSNFELWVNKYTPESLKDVIGSPKNVNDIIDWGNRFSGADVPKTKKAMLFIGGPGVGKTSTAHAMAKSYNWEIYEINASEFRTHDMLSEELTSVATTTSFAGTFYRRLILIDEVDSLYTNAGRLDSSGEKAIQELMKISINPIVMTCNNVYRVPMKLREKCQEFKFQGIRENTIKKTLKSIAKKENFKVEDQYIEEIIEKGDLRSSITNLQIMLTTGIVDKIEREKKLTPFEVVSEVFTTHDPESLDGLLIRSELNPDDAIHWIEENIKGYLTGYEMCKAYDAICEADLYLQKAKLTNNYEYWKHAARLMTVGVAQCHMFPPLEPRYDLTQSPTFFKKLSTTKTRRRIVSSLAKKVGVHFHVSEKEFMQSVFPIIQYICIHQSNLEWLIQLTLICNLNEEEIALILDSKPDDMRIRTIMHVNTKISDEVSVRIERHKKKAKALINFFEVPDEEENVYEGDDTYIA